MITDQTEERFIDMKGSFDAKGYCIERSFLDTDTAAALLDMARRNSVMHDRAHAVLDAQGRESRLTLWYEPGDDAFGRLSCCAELDGLMSVLLGGPVAFFHAKLMQKRPYAGGRWEWHQDYGYWYDDGFLRPDMASCYIALEEATLENGCLEVVPGSHRYGRIDHGTVGEQVGADRSRVEAIVERQGTVACELAAGDALVFHANLLHMSGPNRSADSRMGLITSFSRKDNPSVSDDPRFVQRAYSTTSLAELRVDGEFSSDISFLDGRRPIG